MRDNEDLLKLFDHISNGEATDEEISEYNRWCNDFQTQGITMSNIEGITAEMLTEIRKQIHLNSRTHRLSLWVKIAIAASVLLVLTTGGYYLLQSQQSKQIVRNQSNDVAPGSNKAILTLANRHTIILDSAHNGQLARHWHNDKKRR